MLAARQIRSVTAHGRRGAPLPQRMNAPLAAPQSFDDDAWDDLLNYIEERRVIPILGPDLLRVQTDRGLSRCTSGWPKPRRRACRWTRRAREPRSP